MRGESFRFHVAERVLQQPGSDHLSLPQSDPFGQAGGDPNAALDDDEEEPKEVADEDNENQQKPDPDSNPAGEEQDPEEQDFWSCSGEALVRHHCVPRSTLFTPSDPECPLPTKYLDVMRRTYTDLEMKVENDVEDF